MSSRPSSLNPSMADVGIVPRAVHTEFEREEKKIKQFEDINKKFYKDIKCYIDKLDEMIKSEARMINNISSLAQVSLGESATEAPSASAIARSDNNCFDLNELNRELLSKLTNCRDLLAEHAKSVENFKSASQLNVAEPLKNLSSIFPKVYDAIERRKAVNKELVKLQERLDRLQGGERTGDNLVQINRLMQSVAQKKQEFQNENLFLMEELPKLYASRIDYIKPCVNTLIGSQAKFYQEYSQFYETILNEPTSPQLQAAAAAIAETDNSSENNVDKLSSDIQQCLKDIKSLSIVASD